MPMPVPLPEKISTQRRGGAEIIENLLVNHLLSVSPTLSLCVKIFRAGARARARERNTVLGIFISGNTTRESRRSSTLWQGCRGHRVPYGQSPLPLLFVLGEGVSWGAIKGAEVFGVSEVDIGVGHAIKKFDNLLMGDRGSFSC